MKHKRFLKYFIGLWFLFGPIEAGGLWSFNALSHGPSVVESAFSFFLVMSLMGAVLSLVLALGTWNLKEMEV